MDRQPTTLISVDARRAIACLTLVAVAWQALIWATPLGLSQPAQALMHAIEHAHAVNHHHVGDPSLRVIESADGSLHQHAGEGTQPVAVAAPLVIRTPALRAAPPDAAGDTDVATVFLEGPLRPPKPAA